MLYGYQRQRESSSFGAHNHMDLVVRRRIIEGLEGFI